MNATGIDHAVIIVADLGVARKQFERLGFSVTARAEHGHTGTANHLLIFEDTYVELLGIARAAPENSMFQAELAEREGYWLTALRTDDAAAEHAHLAGIGFETDLPQKWSRALNVDNPEIVSFSTLFIPPAATPQAGFFYCQHHDRSTVLDPALTHHPNGVNGITGAVVAASGIDTLTAPYQHLFGVGSIIQQPASAILNIGPQSIRFESEACLRNRFGCFELPEPLKGPNFAEFVKFRTASTQTGWSKRLELSPTSGLTFTFFIPLAAMLIERSWMKSLLTLAGQTEGR